MKAIQRTNQNSNAYIYFEIFQSHFARLICNIVSYYMDVWCSAGHFVHFNSNKASRSVLESDIDFALKPHLRWKIRWNQDWPKRRRWRVKLEASIAFLQTSLFVLFETWIAIYKFKIDSFSVLFWKVFLFWLSSISARVSFKFFVFSFSSMLFGCNW